MLAAPNMKVLFYRYNSLMEPHVIDCFKNSGIEVVEDTRQFTEKNLTASQVAKDMAEHLNKHAFMFVFSINFFPAVSEVCEIYQIPYVCWTVDCPIMELFSPSIKNKYNRIFFFDRAQYEQFGLPLGTDNAFYLPLAANVKRYDNVISSAKASELEKFKSDISMIGSLYNEKNPYAKIKNIPEYLKGYVSGIESAQMQIYGYNMIESLLTEEIVKEFEKIIPDIQDENATLEVKRYKLAHFLIGYDLAYHERVTLLNALAEHYKVDLYTLSDASALNGVRLRGQAKTLTEMPLIFHQSKINLNFTMRPIQTGLSLRLFDVTGCGGFLMTNYQQELPELFEIGEEVETFCSQDELIDKVGYYLTHEEQRQEIAKRGYERVKAQHTYEHRFKQMIAAVLKTM